MTCLLYFAQLIEEANAEAQGRRQNRHAVFGDVPWSILLGDDCMTLIT
jgi:hypothetical protein